MRTVIIAVALLLPACSLQTLPPPGAVASATILDERVATGFELAYTAAARSAALARQAKLISDADWPKVKASDMRAYAALQAVRAAYRAGNAATFDAALAEARAAVSALVVAAK
jgi:hypothetical protein